jgi:uncharacterized membrane protein
VRSSVLRAAFIAASVAWALILPLAPFVASRPHASAPAAAFVLAVYGIGALICHQLPARSFRAFAVQLPVCARCTGIYAGAAMAAILAASHRTGEAAPVDRTTVAQGFSPARAAQRRLRLTLAAAAAPTALTLIGEWTTGVTPSNTIRFAAGLPLGAAIAWVIVRAAEQDHFARREAAGG